MDTNQEIAIIGAGICGLTTGIALQSEGFEVTIYEQTPDLRAVGAGITLWHNAMLVLHQLGVADQIQEAGRPLYNGGIFNKDGKQLVNTDIDYFDQQKGVQAVAIHRGELMRILIDALGEDSINTNRQLIEYETKPLVLKFNDDYQVQPDLALAADGIFSTTRSQMYNHDPLRYAGYAAFRGVVQYSKDRVNSLRPEMGEYWGRGRRFGIVPISDTQVYWFCTINAPEDRELDRTAYRQHLTDNFGTWTDLITNLINDTPDNEILRNNIYDIKPTPGWSSGRICLMGDAAHATTPNMGQGAGMAIEDAFVMADQLSTASDYKTTYQRFENIRYERCKIITTTSHRIGNVGSWQNAFITKARNTIVKLTSWYTEKQLLQAITFDYIEQN